MTDGARTTSDPDLVQSFLEVMQQFVHTVRAQTPTEARGRIIGRIDIAFHRARTHVQRALQKEEEEEEGDLA
jgi:hypothetical protein